VAGAWQLEGCSDDRALARSQGRAGLLPHSGDQDAIEFSPRTFDPTGDKVYVRGRYAWEVRKSGKPAAADWCHVFTLRGGKVSRFDEFTDTAAFADAYRG
jgi:ketosteroid isomerase-like protein